MIRIHRHPEDAPPEPKDPGKPPRLFYNWISLVGGILAIAGLTGALFFIIIDAESDNVSGYTSMTYIPPLGVYVLGLVVVVLGIFVEQRHRASGKAPTISGKWSLSLNLDRLTQPKVVWTISVVALVLTLSVLAMGAGSIKMVEYTESNQFCAVTCHQVMGPEATVYEYSAHARIDCVECHVGHGADGYIRAKLSGLRQLYGVATGDFNRPIPTPIHNRRPSRDMCESCHWKDRLIDYKVLSREYYHADKASTPAEVKFMVKIGGGGKDGELIQGAGIHYHMLTEQKVEYIARDHARQDIPYVRVTHPDGEVTEFNNTDHPLTEEERLTLEVHQIECVDCHSRPAHQFPAPVNSVNRAIASGKLSRELPYIKLQGVTLLTADYATQDEAVEGIATGLRDYYAEEAPEVLTEKATQLEQGITTLQEIYRRSIFPEMKADWAAHPNNIGHRDSPGCFRCHNEEMQTDDGEAIFTDCTKCHLILAQAQGGQVVEAQSNFMEGQAFVHPDDDEPLTDYTLCSDCHNGGIGVYE